MTDRPLDKITPDLLAELPMQPTGNGVADLEIAYEQMKLDEEAQEAERDDPANAAEAEAHPS